MVMGSRGASTRTVGVQAPAAKATTASLGYEIWMDAEDAVRVWDVLIDAGRSYGVMPAGILALDVARIEAGLVLIDVDYVPAHRAVIEMKYFGHVGMCFFWLLF